MSVRVASYGGGRWEVDIRARLANGKRLRERRVVSNRSKSAAKRWGEDRERYLFEHGPAETPKEVPTLVEFAPRFLDGHARANRQKPSTIAATKSILKWHLVPVFGEERLEDITNEAVQKLKLGLADRAPKTVNNVLTVLNTLLKKAVEWGELAQMPCTIKLLRNPKKEMVFYDFEEYERVLVAAQKQSRETYVMILLGGDAGLRLGEIVALEWGDIDLHARRLVVQRADWLGQVNTRKGGRSRRLPLTRRLTSALKADRHLRSDRVLCLQDGSPFTRDRVIKAIRASERVAGVPYSGRPHPSSHVLFAPGDAWRTGEGNSGTRRTCELGDDPALHASQSERDGGCDSIAGRNL